jgi:LysR family transcriptional regulator, nitrogen assimilation regulatory protein
MGESYWWIAIRQENDMNTRYPIFGLVLMKLDHLRVFRCAAELGSFTKAAVSLGLAQPTVSRLISELEEELNGALFYRSGRGVQLSELGRETLERACVLLRNFDQFSEDLKTFSRVPTGNVSLALPPSLIGPILSELYNQLRVERPGIRLRVREGFGEQIAQWLSEGVVDIGIYSSYAVDGKFRDAPLKGSSMMQSTSMVVACRSPNWERGAEIEFRDLAGLPLVLPAIPNGLRMAIDATAKRMKIELRIVAEVDSIRSQVEMALRCGCYIIKAPNAFPTESQNERLLSNVIRNPSFTRQIILLTGQQRPLSRAARDVAARIATILRELPKQPC